MQSTIIAGLAAGRTLVVLGAGQHPLSLSTGFLVGSERNTKGSIMGTPHASGETLRFSLLTQVHPWIETMPLGHAAEACQRMRSGDAKFRVVLTMHSFSVDSCTENHRSIKS